MIINICIYGFSGPLALGLKWGVGSKVWKGWCDVDLQGTRFYFWGFFYICANFGENRSRNATVRVPTEGYTDTLTDENRFYYSASKLLTMQTAVTARASLSVRPSVCPSVTFRRFVQTNEDTIVRFSASGRKII